jgi:hypothetical protein
LELHNAIVAAEVSKSKQKEDPKFLFTKYGLNPTSFVASFSFFDFVLSVISMAMLLSSELSALSSAGEVVVAFMLCRDVSVR